MGAQGCKTSGTICEMETILHRECVQVRNLITGAVAFDNYARCHSQQKAMVTGVRSMKSTSVRSFMVHAPGWFSPKMCFGLHAL